MAEEYVFNENELELVALRWLEEVGYTSVSAKELEDSGMSKRKDYVKYYAHYSDLPDKARTSKK